MKTSVYLVKAAGPLLPSYSETEFIYGVGMGVHLTRAFFLSAEYQQTTGSDFETFRLSAGVRF